MTDQELTTAVRKSVNGARMSVPEEQIASRGRAIRAGRRRRLAAGVTAAMSAGAAAIAAAVFLLPGPAAPATQDTAYVVSHATQALDAVPAGTIVQVRQDATSLGVTKIWAGDGKLRIERFTRAGKLSSDFGSSTTRTAFTQVTVNYSDKTWARASGPPVASPTTPSFTCASVSAEFGIYVNPSREAAWLRTAVSCGTLKADGTATVDGVSAIKLVMASVKVKGASLTLYVSPKTYLPVRLMSISAGHSHVMQADYQWLPPTTANLAKLDLPAVPRGFTQARQ
jgi:hypothetical protein